MLTYLSDIGTGLEKLPPTDPHWWGPSLDHTVWFHHPARMDDWVLVDLVPVAAAGARGFYTGTVHDRSGRLLATIAQEHVMRPSVAGSEWSYKRAERAAVDEDLRAVDVARRVAGEEHAHADHVLGLADAPHRVRRVDRSTVPGAQPCVTSVSNGPGITVFARTFGLYAPASPSVSALSPAFAIA